MPQLIVDYESLVNDVMITNATYLGISVVVVLALAGLSGFAVYSFQIKPYQIKIQKAYRNLINLKKETEKLSAKVDENIIKLEKGISNAKKILERKLNNFEDRFSELENRLESLTDSTKLTIDENIQALKTEQIKLDAEFKKLKKEFEHEVYDLKVEHHIQKNQVGAAHYLVRKLESELDAGWTGANTLNDIEVYVIEHGIADYYVEPMKIALAKVQNNTEKVEKILEEISKNTFTPEKRVQNDSD